MNNTIVVIGALGGSGTRAIAQLFLELGWFMGDDLNKSNDNLLFTRLFKNPSWFHTASVEDKIDRLKIFMSYMQTGLLTSTQLKELHFAAKSNTLHSSSRYYTQQLNSQMVQRSPKNWGWKEPNSFHYLSEILQFDDRTKYVHVVRHGLDMAFSTNKQQLNNWGFKYGINVNEEDTNDILSVKQLDYWIKTTKEFIDIQTAYPSRCHLLDFTELLESTETCLIKLSSFLDLTSGLDHLSSFIEIPESHLRYKSQNLSIFRRDQIETVKELGYQV